MINYCGIALKDSKLSEQDQDVLDEGCLDFFFSLLPKVDILPIKPIQFYYVYI